MWTVTLLLKPVIVTLHLLGGMTLLALLVWLYARQSDPSRRASDGMAAPPRAWAALALVLVFGQIALGGWVSSNYAALACPDFPLCHGRLVPPMDWSHAFDVVRKLGMTVDGEPIPTESLVAIHFTHRLGAYAVLFVCAFLAWRLGREASTRHLGVALAAVVLLQFTLGMLNVWLSLPLALAAAHNAGAALLLGTLVLVNFRLARLAAARRPLRAAPSGTPRPA
jgi:cytochrome c oxidase assembly protein subunit 15